MPENDKKQNPDGFHSKYQKHVACSYSCKLVCFDDKFSEPFKSYLSQDAVYNFINSMAAENKCCTDMKKTLQRRTCYDWRR